MTAIRRAAILRLATAAYEMELDVMNGVVSRKEDGQWLIGRHDLEELLASYEGEELVLILGSLADERPVEKRTCHTCGRDYEDFECPYCRASRIRLRGEA